MKKTHLPIIILLAAAPLAVFPQTAKKTGDVKFTSVYTDLDKDCKDAWVGKDKKEALSRGQDIPQTCKGFGGYTPYISYSAIESYLSLRKGDDENSFVSVRPNDSKFIEQPGGKLEWRLANGKPFAVIVRFAHFKSDYEGDAPFDTKNKTGESLVVKGLQGFEKIDFELDAKTPNANQKARDLADAEFGKGK